MKGLLVVLGAVCCHTACDPRPRYRLVEENPTPLPVLVKEGTGQFPVHGHGTLKIKLKGTARVRRVTGFIEIDHSNIKDADPASNSQHHIIGSDMGVILSSPDNHECFVRNVRPRPDSKFGLLTVVPFEFDNFKDHLGRWDRALGFWNLTVTDKGNEYVGDIVKYEFRFHLLAVKPDRPNAPIRGKTTATSISVSWLPPEDLGGYTADEVVNYELSMAPGMHESYCESSDQLPESFQVVYKGKDLFFATEELLGGSLYEFRVRVTTPAGTSAFSPALLAKTSPGRPEAPEDFNGTVAYAQELHMAWTAPDDRGSEITGYKIEMMAPLTDIWVEVCLLEGNASHPNPPRCCLVEGLIADTTYSFRGKAYNEIGESDWGPPRELCTRQKPPEKPESPQLAGRSPTSIDLEWEAPNDFGSEITKYKVEEAPEEEGPWQELFTGPDLKITVDELEPDQTYWFRLKAVNKVGWSPYSAAVAYETEERPKQKGRHKTVYSRSGAASDAVVLFGLHPVSSDSGAPVSGVDLIDYMMEAEERKQTSAKARKEAQDLRLLSKEADSVLRKVGPTDVKDVSILSEQVDQVLKRAAMHQ